MIFGGLLIAFITLNSNSAENESNGTVYIIIAFLGLILNIYILYNLYKAGDNLENVKLLSNGQFNKSNLKSNMPIPTVSKPNILGRVDLAKEGIIIYTDELDKHGLVFSKNNLGKTNWDDGKNLCESYKGGGYSDWRLPNKDELQLFYNWKLDNHSSVIINNFWSSEENDESSSYYQDINTGYFNISNKINDRYVRAVRSF